MCKGKSYETLTIVIDSNKGENPVYYYYKKTHFKGVWDKNINTCELESFDEKYLKDLTNIKIVNELLEKYQKQETI